MAVVLGASHRALRDTRLHGAPSAEPLPESDPLPAALLRYHQTLKARLDPERIFNPGRLYADL